MVDTERGVGRSLHLAMRAGILAVSTVGVVACGGDDVAGPSLTEAEEVRRLALSRGMAPLPPPPSVRSALVELGRHLMFDKVLSGNHDVSCMTCHLPRFGTSDGLRLSIGQGAAGLGPDRTHPGDAFIARNALPLFNLGMMGPFFWDGRLFLDGSGQVRSPAGGQLTPEIRAPFEFGALSALGLFPVADRAEMRAEDGSELAAIPDADSTAIWAALMDRLAEIPEYRAAFEAAYPGRAFEEMTFGHASNAMAGFLLARFTLADSPWDRFLRGADGALEPEQLEGARTFLRHECAVCHRGPALTDLAFHNTALPQFGPGKGNGPTGRDDFGRMNVSGASVEIYEFRTPSLRNVELTAPYGHTGQFETLRSFVFHYDDSERALHEYPVESLPAAMAATFVQNYDAVMANRDPLLRDMRLTETEVDRIVAFLRALTDPGARDLSWLVPDRVPSGLPIDR